MIQIFFYSLSLPAHHLLVLVAPPLLLAARGTPRTEPLPFWRSESHRRHHYLGLWLIILKLRMNLINLKVNKKVYRSIGGAADIIDLPWRRLWLVGNQLTSQNLTFKILKTLDYCNSLVKEAMALELFVCNKWKYLLKTVLVSVLRFPNWSSVLWFLKSK